MKRSSSLAMQRYSAQPRDRIFVKAYGFLSFARNMGKNVGKNISKNFSSKYSHKLFDHAKQSTTDTLETPSQNTAEATDDLIGNKIAEKISALSKNLTNEKFRNK